MMTGHRLIATGEAHADMPLRLLNLFAVNGVVFDAVEIDRDGDVFVVRVALQDIAPARRETMLSRIQTMVSVRDARWENIFGRP